MMHREYESGQRLSVLERMPEGKAQSASTRMQDDERVALSRELHDQIGQSLTVLNLLINRALRTSPDQMVSVISEAPPLITELMGRVRKISAELRPLMLEGLELLPALLWHFERYTAQTQIRVDFNHSGLERRFPAEVNTVAYRIVQEALTNVAHHAGVTQVTARAWATRNGLNVQIEDRGTGFDASSPSRLCGGLNGMRERALLIGGKVTIASVPGKGTVVTARLPLSEQEDREVTR